MSSPVERKLRDNGSTTTHIGTKSEKKKARYSSKATSNIFKEIKGGKYGSVTNDIESLLEMERQTFISIHALGPQALNLKKQPVIERESKLENVAPLQNSPIIIIDSDDEEIVERTSSNINHSMAFHFQVNESAETCFSQNQNSIKRHEDDNETRKYGGTYFGKENVTPTEHNHQAASNFTKMTGNKELSDNESTCIGLENFQKKDGNYQISYDTRVQEQNHQIYTDNLILAAANGFGEDDGISVDMEIDDDDNSVANNFVSVDMEIEKDDTPIGDINQRSELDNSRFSGDSEIEEDEGSNEVVSDSDDLENVWKEMNFALECSKEIVNIRPEERVKEENYRDCDHSFVLRDDLGYVCRVCGVIDRGIDTIIAYQFAKSNRSIRTYHREAQTNNSKESHEFNSGSNSSGLDIQVEDFSIHPKHAKQMKAHQLEGFKFLLNNLVTENPGGCILAHAPGSGKTFMIISFMQSFLAKYPQARPLVVLPRGIVSTWKKEFNRWQIEDIPLYDFYSMKADSRAQQLEVLKQWAGQRSILFLGYQQFSKIVCDNESNETASACQNFLLQYPSILILDEGHTPRNEETDLLSSLKKVQTPRKVVLSGTLYQNHVKEVFNIFDLVRPKFLRQGDSREIMNKILSKVSCARKHGNPEDAFYESVESTLQKDEDFKRKISVIKDLREMTSNVLHFYKGDFLDELPGILDFTVFLNLSDRQKEGVKEFKRYNQRFKVISEGCALYVHPDLRDHLNSYLRKERERLDDAKLDLIIEKLDISDGVKAKFFINLLGLCETTGEKLLVFSQYIQPIKFLERLVVKIKKWSLGKEIFVITGDSNSGSRDSSMEQFNNSSSSKVFFGSIKACGEGISLVGASRIIILDVHLNPSVTRQAIGRAFRPGQDKKVYVYRLVASESPEEDDHLTCFRKESISKMWFEWNELCGPKDFEMQSVDVRECGDEFLESPKLSADIKSLYQR